MAFWRVSRKASRPGWKVVLEHDVGGLVPGDLLHQLQRHPRRQRHVTHVTRKLWKSRMDARRSPLLALRVGLPPRRRGPVLRVVKPAAASTRWKRRWSHRVRWYRSRPRETRTGSRCGAGSPARRRAWGRSGWPPSAPSGRLHRQEPPLEVDIGPLEETAVSAAHGRAHARDEERPDEFVVPRRVEDGLEFLRRERLAEDRFRRPHGDAVNGLIEPGGDSRVKTDRRTIRLSFHVRAVMPLSPRRP